MAATQSIQEHIAGGGGICGTCAQPANATAENDGYSSCCNDRIEYGDEARETVAQANCDHAHTKVERVVCLGFGPEFKQSISNEIVCADCGAYIGDAA